MKHYTVIFRPEGVSVSIHSGATILEAAGQAGIILNNVCGGGGTCGKCAVQLEEGGQEVLACQYHIEDDLTVTVPVESRFFQQKILEHGIDTQVELSPPVKKRIGESAGIEGGMFGAAIDIGTTTVVAKLFDLSNGRCVATAATGNPQSDCGDDVISRISYAESDRGLNKLHDSIVECVNSLVKELCKAGGIVASDIYEVVAVGNTTMNHLFLKMPVAQLGQAPYAAHSVAACDRIAKEMSVKINPSGNVHTVENIAGFVGSDTTAAVLAVGMDTTEKITLVVDIGTNGELVLGKGDKMYAASCAAGPALEGARIAHGSRAVEGAIERVIVNGDDIDVDVVGGAAARSICGSGLIDAVAVLLELGIVDERGRFVKVDKLKGALSESILARRIEHDGQAAFILADKAGSDGRRVIVTQKDIREAQLAKAAIGAGTILLMKKMGITTSDIEQIFLAGAFGNFIRRQSAVRIGLLPDVGVEKIHFVGNAACSGAEMILLSDECRKTAAELAEKIEYIEIAYEPEFQISFAESLMFPA